MNKRTLTPTPTFHSTLTPWIEVWTRVGTWIFSTEMDGKKPYKQSVPITPLTSGRSQLQASISKIVP